MHVCLRLAPPTRPKTSKSKSNSGNATYYSRITYPHHPHHHHHHSLLLSAGLSPAQVSRLVASRPLLLTQPFYDDSLRFLAHLFPPEDLARAVALCPRLLACPVPSQLSPALLLLRRLHVPITPATSLLLASHVDTTLRPKLHFLLHSLRLPYRDVTSVLSRFPRLLTYSIPNNLHPKAHYLHHHMHRHVPTEIRNFPQYFAFNLDNRIKRRHRLLLQNGFRMSLREMLTTSDGDFDQRIFDRKLQIVDRILTRTNNTPSS